MIVNIIQHMPITSNAMDAADLARSSDINRYNHTISLQHLNVELHLFTKSNALYSYILGDPAHAEHVIRVLHKGIEWQKQQLRAVCTK